MKNLIHVKIMKFNIPVIYDIESIKKNFVC